MSLRPLRWMGTGLLFALFTGLGAMLMGYPFLTTHTAHLTLPLLGEIHVASALFFDIGVYAVVVGSTLLILTALAHQSVRSHRPTALPKPIAAKPDEPGTPGSPVGARLARE
jgi:multicomponent K+:H+ antiporter subunit A